MKEGGLGAIVVVTECADDGRVSQMMSQLWIYYQPPQFNILLDIRSRIQVRHPFFSLSMPVP